MSLDPNRFTRMSVDDLTTPKTGRVVYCDHWWIVTPENEVLFYSVGKAFSPQCNLSESIAKRFGYGIEGCVPRLIPVAYLPARAVYDTASV